MADNRVTARLPAGMLRRLDEQRGDVERAEYARRALERQLREDEGRVEKVRRG